MTEAAQIRWRAALVAVVAAIGGAALVAGCFYPGYMSSDSVDQLGQARTGVYNAGHPPMMAWLWHFTDAVVPGPLGMVLLQNALFWGGLAMLATMAVPSAWSGAAVLAVGLLPPVFALLGTVWKDVQMAAALVVAFALLCRAKVSRDRGFAFVALLPLWYGCAVRKNAPAAVLPLALSVIAILLPERLARRRAATAAGGCALVAAFMVLTGIVDTAITGGRNAAPIQSQQFMLHDLVGISVGEQADLLPHYLHEGAHAISMTGLAPLYQPETSDPLIFNPGTHVWAAQNSVEAADLRAHWLTAVRQHPGTYLRHRWQLTRTLIGLAPHVWYPHHFQIDSNPFGITLASTAANRAAMRLLNAVHDSFLFRGWIYLLLLAAALVRAAARGLRPCWASATLAASGLAYCAPYFFLAPAPDFRYLWWTVLCALLLPFALRVERQNGRAPGGSEALAPAGSLG